MIDDSLFGRSPADWSDDELRVGLTQIAERTVLLHNVACELVDERDRRRRLYAEMDRAANPVRVVAPARILRSPAERREDRRNRRVD